MFNSRAKDDTKISDKMETIIGKDVEFKGIINAAGGIRIDGRVDGEIANKGDIFIGDEAVVTASITARNLVIAGTVNGNLHAEGKIELRRTARVTGDMKAGLLVIEEGAVFQGKSEMKTESESPKKSPGMKPAKA